jgi:hypothetical protein
MKKVKTVLLQQQDSLNMFHCYACINTFLITDTGDCGTSSWIYEYGDEEEAHRLICCHEKNSLSMHAEFMRLCNHFNFSFGEFLVSYYVLVCLLRNRTII